VKTAAVVVFVVSMTVNVALGDENLAKKIGFPRKFDPVKQVPKQDRLDGDPRFVPGGRERKPVLPRKGARDLRQPVEGLWEQPPQPRQPAAAGQRDPGPQGHNEAFMQRRNQMAQPPAVSPGYSAADLKCDSPGLSDCGGSGIMSRTGSPRDEPVPAGRIAAARWPPSNPH